MLGRRSALAALLVLGALGALGLGWFVRASDQHALASVEVKVRRDYPAVAQLKGDELAALEREKGDGIVLLDVREEDEFAVSHLEGANRIDPRLSAAQFSEALGPAVHGKTVVLYCAVGVRSSRLADRISAVAKEAGANGVYSLEGGIFRWHNEGRPLVRGSQQTQEVHAYDRQWGQLLERQDLAVFTPGGAPLGK